MDYLVQFPQADNLEFVYQVFIELSEEGLHLRINIICMIDKAHII